MQKVSKSFDGVCYSVDIDEVLVYRTEDPEKAEEVFVRISNLFSELSRYDPYALSTIIVEDDTYTPIHIKVFQDKFRVYTEGKDAYSITVTGVDRMCNITKELTQKLLEEVVDCSTEKTYRILVVN